MNNKELPIRLKTPERILKIAKAKSNKSYDLTKSNFTEFWNELNETVQTDFKEFIKSPKEIGYLFYFRNHNNWTLLTSHNLIGKKDGKIQKVELQKIKSKNFGIIKSISNKSLLMNVRSKFKNYEFEYESNGPGFVLMVSLNIIQNHWERRAIDENIS